MSGIDPLVAVHRLNVDLRVKLIRQKKRSMDAACNATRVEEVAKLLKADFIRSPLSRMAVQRALGKKCQLEMANACRLSPT